MLDFNCYGLKEWIIKRYYFASFYYGIIINDIQTNNKHKLIEPRPIPIELPYNSSITYIKTELNEFYLIEFDNNFPKYNPNKNYYNGNIPILKINQYNKNVEKSN